MRFLRELLGRVVRASAGALAEAPPAVARRVAPSTSASDPESDEPCEACRVGAARTVRALRIRGQWSEVALCNACATGSEHVVASEVEDHVDVTRGTA